MDDFLLPKPPAADRTPGGEHLIARTQASFNHSTRDHWDHFARHREQIAKLLLPEDLPNAPILSQPGGRLGVLGAGNCNDLDLPRLLSAFSQVHLVDIDSTALSAAVDRQGVANHPSLHLHPNIDLTSVAGTMAAWPTKRPTNAEISQCIRTLDIAAQPDVGGPFDVLLSPCVLSQICLYASDMLGKDHPRRRDVRLAIRRRHLRQMVDWLAPGGMGLLVIDLATTDRVGSLVHTHRDRLDEAARRTVARADHFPGLEPESIKAALEDPSLAGLVSSVQAVTPWVWTLGPKKAFLVYAVRFKRTSAPLLK